ncbi:unnamed protein product [Prorocentrum cordatum]|uniref:Uncharacterized protein n=1 Tax=Prorocentrum cordatum TaxID=2364126 RepID=A0ABN9RN16_9DINO|nr:unnamed protein product [Polarella glacialis]
MGLASHARWARCRAARVSPWARRMNLSAFGSKRWHGIAAAQPAQLLCAEVRPALCFPEQSCGAGSSGTAPGARGEGGADPSEEDGLALLIDRLERDGLAAGLLAELFKPGTTCGVAAAAGTAGASPLARPRHRQHAHDRGRPERAGRLRGRAARRGGAGPAGRLGARTDCCTCAEQLHGASDG